MKKNKRKSKSRKKATRAAIAPVPTKKVTPFDFKGYTLTKVLAYYAMASFLLNASGAVEMAPPLERLAAKFLAIVEWPWRKLFEALGVKFISEAAVMMTCFIALMTTALTAMALEKKHTPAPAWLRESDKAEQRRLMGEWWGERYVQAVCMACIATASFVIATDSFVFSNTLSGSITRLPIWYWLLHGFALIACLPALVMRHDARRLAEILAVGVVCGAGLFLIWLPSASRAAAIGGGEVDYFRQAVLDFNIWRFTGTLAGLLSMATAPFMLARLLLPVSLGALLVILSATASVMAG